MATKKVKTLQMQKPHQNQALPHQCQLGQVNPANQVNTQVSCRIPPVQTEMAQRQIQIQQVMTHNP